MRALAAIAACALVGGCGTLVSETPASGTGASEAPAADRPNVVLILTDDQGFGDLGCQGAPTIHTPRLDALAARGMRLTQFYVASSVCTPSRAALMTGCYPKRVGLENHVVFPPDDHGLHPDEVTLAEVLRDAGYATGCFGKWHLGHRPGLLPLDQGFDVFEGVPYSNDMAQFHRLPGSGYRFRLPWMVGSEVVEWEPDQRALTQRTTDAAIAFIEAHAGERFFAYVPYSMPHIPLYASPEHEGTSARGLYGDVIEELDASVGAILDALARTGVAEDTVVLFTSDNGPWLSQNLRGGSAGPLRGGKGTTFEGGHRVPFVAAWPGRIPAGRTSSTVVTALDVLPTIAGWVGAELPERTLDGGDAGAVLRGIAGAVSPNEVFLFYSKNGALAGIRSGPWKLHLDRGELYHVEHDVAERFDVAERNQGLVASLTASAEALDAEIEATRRPVGRVEAVLFDPERP